MDISLHHHSGIHTLTSKQLLKADLDTVWDFFSRPQNLDWMTPDDMKFKITSPNLPEKTYQGQIITYDIEILPKFPQSWVTEITLIQEKKLFVDEQRFGPYTMWHHEHHFEEVGGDVMMTDIISFKLPLGILGDAVASSMIEKRLKTIFEYRFHFCERYFNKK